VGLNAGSLAGSPDRAGHRRSDGHPGGCAGPAPGNGTPCHPRLRRPGRPTTARRPYSSAHVRVRRNTSARTALCTTGRACSPTARHRRPGGGGYPHRSAGRGTRRQRVSGVSLLRRTSAATPCGRRPTSTARRPTGQPVVDQIVWVLAAHHTTAHRRPALLARPTRRPRHPRARRPGLRPVVRPLPGPGLHERRHLRYPSRRPRRRPLVLRPGPSARRQADVPVDNCLYYGHSPSRHAEALGRPCRQVAALGGEAPARGDRRHLWRADAGTYGYLVHGTGPLQDGSTPRRRARALPSRLSASPTDSGPVGSSTARTGSRTASSTSGRTSRASTTGIRPAQRDGLADGARSLRPGRPTRPYRTVRLAVDASPPGHRQRWLLRAVQLRDGAVDGGWQAATPVGRALRVPARPTWSATRICALSTRPVRHQVHGRRPTTAPVPALDLGLGAPARLPYRNMTLDITLTGGEPVRRCTVDGRPGSGVSRTDGRARSTSR